MATQNKQDARKHKEQLTWAFTKENYKIMFIGLALLALGFVLMIGGGSAWNGNPMPTSLHYYVPDADSIYRCALEAGAESEAEPVDQPYGDREAAVKDVAGNHWYIATHQGPGHIPEGLHSIQAYLHAHDAAALIEFLGRALGAQELAREILAQIQEGAPFAQMAAIYNDGSQPGGDWGWRPRSDLRKDLAAVAFNLKPGQHSGVIDAPDGCYLLQVEARRAAIAGLDRATADRLSQVCPSRALRPDGDVLVYDVGACTACCRCSSCGGWVPR